MLVTDIQDHKNKRVKIFLDGELAFVLYKGELSEYGISSGCELSRSAYDTIMGELLVKRARLRCLKLLTDRPYSEYGLRQKLSEALYPPEIIDNAIEYAKSFGYINDKQYAADMYESLSARYPSKVIEQKLRQKGISDDIIRSCLNDSGSRKEQNEEELIKKLILKKCKGNIPDDPKEKEKLLRFLAGKGFTYSQISDALKGY